MFVTQSSQWFPTSCVPGTIVAPDVAMVTYSEPVPQVGIVVGVRVGVLVEVLVGVTVGVFVDVGVKVDVSVEVTVGGVPVGVSVGVPQVGCSNCNSRPLLRLDVSHENCVIWGPVPF